MRLRPATPDDAVALARLWERSARAGFGPIFGEGWEPPEHDPERTAGILADPAVRGVVAQEGERLLGYSIFGANRDPDPQPGTGELRTLFVEPDAWGTGVAAAVLDATLDGLRELGYQRVMVWSFDENRRANAFYERHGFRRDGGEMREELWEYALIVRLSRPL